MATERRISPRYQPEKLQSERAKDLTAITKGVIEEERRIAKKIADTERLRAALNHIDDAERGAIEEEIRAMDAELDTAEEDLKQALGALKSEQALFDREITEDPMRKTLQEIYEQSAPELAPYREAYDKLDPEHRTAYRLTHQGEKTTYTTFAELQRAFNKLKPDEKESVLKEKGIEVIVHPSLYEHLEGQTDKEQEAKKAVEQSRRRIWRNPNRFPVLHEEPASAPETPSTRDRLDARRIVIAGNLSESEREKAEETLSALGESLDLHDKKFHVVHGGAAHNPAATARGIIELSLLEHEAGRNEIASILKTQKEIAELQSKHTTAHIEVDPRAYKAPDLRARIETVLEALGTRAEGATIAFGVDQDADRSTRWVSLDITGNVAEAIAFAEKNLLLEITKGVPSTDKPLIELEKESEKNATKKPGMLARIKSFFGKKELGVDEIQMRDLERTLLLYKQRGVIIEVEKDVQAKEGMPAYIQSVVNAIGPSRLLGKRIVFGGQMDRNKDADVIHVDTALPVDQVVREIRAHLTPETEKDEQTLERELDAARSAYAEAQRKLKEKTKGRIPALFLSRDPKAQAITRTNVRDDGELQTILAETEGAENAYAEAKKAFRRKLAEGKDEGQAKNAVRAHIQKEYEQLKRAELHGIPPKEHGAVVRAGIAAGRWWREQDPTKRMILMALLGGFGTAVATGAIVPTAFVAGRRLARSFGSTIVGGAVTQFAQKKLLPESMDVLRDKAMEEALRTMGNISPDHIEAVEKIYEKEIKKAERSFTRRSIAAVGIGIGAGLGFGMASDTLFAHMGIESLPAEQPKETTKATQFEGHRPNRTLPDTEPKGKVTGGQTEHPESGKSVRTGKGSGSIGKAELEKPEGRGRITGSAEVQLATPRASAPDTIPETKHFVIPEDLKIVEKGGNPWRTVHRELEAYAKGDKEGFMKRFGVKAENLTDEKLQKTLDQETLKLLKAKGLIDPDGRTTHIVYEGTKIEIGEQGITVDDHTHPMRIIEESKPKVIAPEESALPKPEETPLPEAHHESIEQTPLHEEVIAQPDSIEEPAGIHKVDATEHQGEPSRSAPYEAPKTPQQLLETIEENKDLRKPFQTVMKQMGFHKGEDRFFAQAKVLAFMDRVGSDETAAMERVRKGTWHAFAEREALGSPLRTEHIVDPVLTKNHVRFARALQIILRNEYAYLARPQTTFAEIFSKPEVVSRITEAMKYIKIKG